MDTNKGEFQTEISSDSQDREAQRKGNVELPAAIPNVAPPIREFLAPRP
jgi:hypothetical protein